MPADRPLSSIGSMLLAAFLATSFAGRPLAASGKPVPIWSVTEGTHAPSRLGSVVGLSQLADGSILLLSRTDLEAVATRFDESGRQLSHVALEGFSPESNAPWAVDPRGFVSGSDLARRETVVRCDARTGRRTWATDLPVNLRGTRPWTGVDRRGNTLVATPGFDQPVLRLLDAATGEVRWSKALAGCPGNLGPVFLLSGNRIIALAGAFAASLDEVTGELRWSAGICRGAQLGAAVAPNGDLLVLQVDWRAPAGRQVSLLRFDAVTGAGAPGIPVVPLPSWRWARLEGVTSAGNPVLSFRDDVSVEVQVLDSRTGAVLTRVVDEAPEPVTAVHAKAEAGGTLLVTVARRTGLEGYSLSIAARDALGVSVFKRVVNGVGYAEPSPLLRARDGSLWIVRQAGLLYPGTTAELFVERMDGEIGHVLASARVSRPACSGAAVWLTRDPHGDVLVASSWSDGYGPTGVRVRKLEAGTGRDLWAPFELTSNRVAALTREGRLLVDSELGGRRVLEMRDRDTGARLWGSDLDGTHGAWLAGLGVTDGDRVVTLESESSGRGRLALRSGDSGRVVWSRDADPQRLAVTPTGIFLAGQGPAFSLVERVDPETGGTLWSVTAPGMLSTAPNGDVFVAGEVVTRLDGATGKTLWAREGPYVDGSAMDSAGDLFLHRQGEVLEKLSGETGERIWSTSTELQGYGGEIAVDDDGDVLVLRRRDAELFCDVLGLRGTDGSERFRLAEGPLSFSPPLVAAGSGFVLAATKADGVHLTAYGDAPGLFAASSLPPVAFCGRSYSSGLEPVNGVPPYRVSVASGALPAGLRLEEATGEIHGTPVESGSFDFRARVVDSTGAAAESSLRLDVFEAGEALRVEAELTSRPCERAAYRLRAPDAPGPVTWYPGGETAESLVVSPGRETTYSVVSVDASGCPRTGFVTLSPAALSDQKPPLVVAPAAMVVRQSVCTGGKPGATPATSTALAAFLSGASASDACAPLTALAPLVAGATVTKDTFLPAGSTEVSFRYVDLAGNSGGAGSTVSVRALGDLDLDAVVGVFDAIILASALVGNAVPGHLPFRADLTDADATRDGLLDVRDLVLVMGHVAGNVSCLTP